MTYRINYRAAQGQQSQGSPGGGYLLDTIRTTWAAMASGAGVSLPVAIVPHFDTTDFGSSILGDYEPQTFTPHVRIGRVTLDRKSTRLNSSHLKLSRMPSSA